jgi:hypothetical protein
LVRRRKPYVQDFGNDAHELAGLLSSTIGNAPECCPECAAETLAAPLSWARQHHGFAEAAR